MLCCVVLRCTLLNGLQMLGLSLLMFRHPKHTASKLIRAASGALTPPQQGWMGANMPVMLMYLPVHVFFALWVLSFVFMPQRVALSLWVAFLVPYYGFTHWGNPAHTGGHGAVRSQWRYFASPWAMFVRDVWCDSRLHSNKTLTHLWWWPVPAPASVATYTLAGASNPQPKAIPSCSAAAYYQAAAGRIRFSETVLLQLAHKYCRHAVAGHMRSCLSVRLPLARAVVPRLSPLALADALV